MDVLPDTLVGVEAETLIYTVPEGNEKTPVHGLADWKTEVEH